MVDGQQTNVTKHFKIKVTSNVNAIILQTLLSCLKFPMTRFEIIYLYYLRIVHSCLG
jgi:hypothetical protein